MHSRLFWKLFVPHSLVVVVAVGAARMVPESQPLALLGLLLVSLASVYWLIVRVVRQVQTLAFAAEKMGSGQYDVPVYINSHDELGQLARKFNGMRRDMDQKLMELRDTNERLSTVLGGMNDGVIAIDQGQAVLFANQAAGKMMGFSPAEAEGTSLLKTVRSHALHDLAVKLLAVPGEQEMELEWGEDTSVSLLVNATSLAGDPSAGVVMLIHNLSEVRRLEAMRRDFVANVSHELKTPLASIKAYAETLSEGAIHDEKHRLGFVRQIEEQADRLNQLISDLLSLARVEQGKQHMEFVQVAVEQAVNACVQEQERSAAAKDIQLQIEPGEQVRVEVDANEFRQILVNLIDNAIKYTPPQGTVTVGWKLDGRHVAIFVRDTGIGIPEAMLDRVFERFFRVDKARSRELGGTGLGLAIVKHLAQSFGGEVDVTSQLDEGSCFTLRLPVSTSPLPTM